MKKITEQTLGKEFFNWLKRVWLIRNVDGKTIISKILPEERTTEEQPIYLFVNLSWWYVDINYISWRTTNDSTKLSFEMKPLKEVVSNDILEKLKKSCFFTRNMGVLRASQVIPGNQEKIPEELIMFYIDDYITDKNMFLLDSEDFIWSESEKPLHDPIFIIDPTSSAYKKMKASEMIEYEGEENNVNDWNIVLYRYFDYWFPIQEFLDKEIGKRQVKKYVEKSKLENTYFFIFNGIYPATDNKNIKEEDIFLFNLSTKAPVKKIIMKEYYVAIDGEDVFKANIPPEIRDYISKIAIE